MDDLRTAVTARGSGSRCLGVGPVHRAVSLLTIVVAILGGCAERERGEERSADVHARPAASLGAVDSLERARQDSINRAQRGYVIDSILPLDEEIRRFRRDLPRVHALHGGASDLASLTQAVVQALATYDTVALRRLALDRAEFAWLVYPSSPYVAPPYRQAPWLVWLQLSLAGEKGLARLLDRYGGRRIAVIDHACDAEPERQGVNLIWRRCAVRLRLATGDTATRRLFGDVVQRDGRVKLVSYGNDL